MGQKAYTVPTPVEREIFNECTLYFLRENWENANNCLKVIDYKIIAVFLENTQEWVYGMIPDRPFGTVSLR